MRIKTQCCYFCYAALLFIIYTGLYVVHLLNVYIQIHNSHIEKYNLVPKKCTCRLVIHLGTILIGYNSTFNFYTSLKSLLLTRNTSLHFHVLSDAASRKNLETMFRTWKIPDVTVDYYDIKLLPPSKYLRLMFLNLINPSVATQTIIFNEGVIFRYNVLELWNLYDNFVDNQVIGLLEVTLNDTERKSVISDIVLYHIGNLNIYRRERLQSVLKDLESRQSDEDVFHVLATQHADLIHNVSCNFKRDYCKVTKINSSTINDTRAITEYDGTLLRDTLSSTPASVKATKNTCKSRCFDFEETIAYSWRILPHVRTFTPDVFANVTFVSQLTLDRIYILDKLVSRWKGPMSLTLYVTEAEFISSLDMIATSERLTNRSNIAYHVVFREKKLHHPINLCRNVAWENAVTPYVFLCDIDFIPMQDLDVALEEHFDFQNTMIKKALVVPAFEMTKTTTNEDYPKDMKEALKLYFRKELRQFSRTRYGKGHAPSDYVQWELALRPYKISWKPGYEPFTVVAYNTVRFDERFVGYGSNKIAHTTHFHLLGYKFVGLPDTFAVHRNHPKSNESKRFIEARYQRCLEQVAIQKALKDLRALCHCKLDKL